jgi:glycosyltransferase involved in cell wall biosynthesis
MIEPEDFITVVIPYYKREHYLKNLLESLQNQNYAFEVVVHADAGNDLVATKYMNLMSELIINPDLNVGLHRSVNRCVAVASSKYILMLNEDMLITKPIFKEIVSVLRKPYIGVLSIYNELQHPPEYIKAYDAKFTLMSGVGWGCAMAFRKEWFNSVGGMFEDTPSCYSDTPLTFKTWMNGYFRGYLLNSGVRNISWEEHAGQDGSIRHDIPDCALPRIFGIDLEREMKERKARADKLFHQYEYHSGTLYNNNFWDDYSKTIIKKDGEISSIDWSAAYKFGQWKHQDLIKSEILYT